MDTDTRPPFNALVYGFTQVIVIAAIIPGFLPKSIKILAILFVGWATFDIIFMRTTGDEETNLILGSSVFGYLLSAIDYSLGPSKSSKKLSDKDTSKTTQQSFRERALWALELYTNPRGIGWSHEPSHLPPRPLPSTPRWKFVISRIYHSIVCFALYSLSKTALASNPGITNPGNVISKAPFHWRILGAVSYGLAGACGISGTQSVLAAIFVGSGISSPDKWPVLFGSLLDAWSIQRFWRRFWHQMLRRSLVSFADSCTTCILPTRSSKVWITFYKILRLYLAFFLSGVLHMCGDRMLYGRISYGSLKFFMSQAVGITIEITISSLWCNCILRKRCVSAEVTVKVRRMIENDSRKDIKYRDEQKSIASDKGRRYATENLPPIWIRCVGFAWVALWILWTVPYFMDPFCSTDIFNKPRVDLRRLSF